MHRLLRSKADQKKKKNTVNIDLKQKHNIGTLLDMRVSMSVYE